PVRRLRDPIVARSHVDGLWRAGVDGDGDHLEASVRAAEHRQPEARTQPPKEHAGSLALAPARAGVECGRHAGYRPLRDRDRIHAFLIEPERTPTPQAASRSERAATTPARARPPARAGIYPAPVRGVECQDLQGALRGRGREPALEKLPRGAAIEAREEARPGAGIDSPGSRRVRCQGGDGGERGTERSPDLVCEN